MKIPLSYQRTEYDCGPTALLNGLSFLFDREELPPDFPSRIMSYCLDGYDKQGRAYHHGTSAAAMRFISSWLNGYSEALGFPLKTSFLCGEEVSLAPGGPITAVLKEGGAAVVRVRYECGHYILLTGFEAPESIGFFDSYYEEGEDIRLLMEAGIEIIHSKPHSMNRRALASWMNQEGAGPYQLEPAEKREALLLVRTGPRRISSQ